MSLEISGFLISTSELHSQLGSPDLRIYDCTTLLEPIEPSGLRSRSAFSFWESSHIPGSAYIDLQEDLSIHDHQYRFMCLPLEQLVTKFENLGIDDQTIVVLYDQRSNMWAARIWWMLRAVGFSNAKILDGGWTKWTVEQREVSTAVKSYPKGQITFVPQPSLFVEKEALINQSVGCIIDALGPEQYSGANGGKTYGRAGHIPQSVNIPANHLVNPDTQEYLSLGELNSIIEPIIPDKSTEIVTYCGGGIAASNDAFVLTMLGYRNVSVYDASLSEWATDETLPLETS